MCLFCTFQSDAAEFDGDYDEDAEDEDGDDQVYILAY